MPHMGVSCRKSPHAHLDAIDVVIGRAIETAGVAMGDLDGVAATGGPGLIGGVVVGTVAAKAIATARGIPYYAVNHLEGHALSPRLVDRVGFPISFFSCPAGIRRFWPYGPGVYERYGTTMDDAAGEAFDKSAKIMGLGYPGGPAIERAAADGNAALVQLRPLRGADHCHFSFFGLKTAVATRFAAIEAGEPAFRSCRRAAAAIADCLADQRSGPWHGLRKPMVPPCWSLPAGWPPTGLSCTARDRSRKGGLRAQRAAGMAVHRQCRDDRLGSARTARQA